MTDRAALLESLELFFQRIKGLMETRALDPFVDVELTFTQVRTLLLLASRRSAPINQIADALGLSVHAAGRNVDRLTETGLVERREDPADRRVKLVSLTPRGLDLIDQHVADRRRAVDLFLDRLPDEQAEALAAALEPILAGDSLDPRPDSPTSDQENA